MLETTKKNNTLVKVVADPKLGGYYSEGSLHRAIILALACTEVDQRKRPNIEQVVRVLKKAQLNDRHKMWCIWVAVIIGVVLNVIRYYIFYST